MFTDMVGYTATGNKDETLSLALVEQTKSLLRPIFAKHDGKEVKTMGDAFLIEFPNALDAIRCGYDIQRVSREYNTSVPTDKRIKLRVGIHLGDVVESSGDIYGDAVNIASRIEPLAAEGGVCLTQQVYDQVFNKFELPLVSLGKKFLKNVNAPIEVYKVEMPWERSVIGESGGLDKRRIAVLPFANMSPDPNDEYFADGITEELISAISHISELSVVSRMSVMGYKKNPKGAAEIGKELKVGTMIEGSVRKAGDRARISVQLIESESDRHLWAENYDRDIKDIFAVQSEIAGRVASSLQVHLLEKDRKKIEKGSTSSVQAHTLYLKGRFHLNRWDEASLLSAIDYFKQAIIYDPNYALAFCGLAFAINKLGFQDMVSPREALSKGEEYANKALELDESLAEAHMALGLILLPKYDFVGAEREFRKAIELNPNRAGAHNMLANTLQFVGRSEECVAELEKTLELDPLSVETAGGAGTAYLYLKQYDKAIEHLNNALEIDPDNTLCRNNLGLAYVQKGMFEKGLAEMKRAEIHAPVSYGDLAYAYVRAGKPDEAKKLLVDLLNPEEKRSVSPIALAGVYANIGEKEKAIECLEKAYEEGSGYLRAINGDFVFDPLRDEPGFKAILKKMGLA